MSDAGIMGILYSLSVLLEKGLYEEAKEVLRKTTRIVERKNNGKKHKSKKPLLEDLFDDKKTMIKYRDGDKYIMKPLESLFR